MTEPKFRRIAIVNRGEPAMRLIVAVRELNRQGERELKTIALYTSPDESAMFVREADEAHSLGTPSFEDASGQLKNRYLDYDALRRALVQTKAEAAWVGWGFVAEHPEFADLCEELGVVFVGPSAEVIQRLGDKITAKNLAEAANVPVAPWSNGPVESIDEAMVHARRLGFPLVIKATAGGGGRGIRKVRSEDELAAAFESARAEALKSFGNDAVFMEKMMEGARHVEVQIIADRHGAAWALGVRDCTIQRNSQKIVEESPSPALTAEQSRDLQDAALRLVKSVGYQNAGTVEFLYDPRERRFAFMEVNTRLQVEHPVTEMTTGIDLVKLQLHVAAGGALEGEPPTPAGHAVEVRLCAEDPDNAFMPAPGRIDLLRVPLGPGVRLDTGVEEGDDVPPQFDSMIAKLIAHGRDRREALARLGTALSRSAVVIEGGTSNKGFLLELVTTPDLVSSDVDIGWLERRMKTSSAKPRRFADVALIAAAIEKYDVEVGFERAHFFASALRGRPHVGDGVGQRVELSYRGSTYELHVLRRSSSVYRLDVDGRLFDVEVQNLGGADRRLIVGSQRYRVLSVNQGVSYLVEVNGVPHRISADSGNTVRAPGPAVVVSVAVKEGDEVQAGDTLAVLEAMKTETTLAAPFAATVKQIHVISNIQVGAGAPLIQLEPPSDAKGVQGDRVSFDMLEETAPEQTVQARWRRVLSSVRGLVRGFDIPPSEAELLRREYESLRYQVEWSPELIAEENDIIATFVDLCALFRRPGSADLAETGNSLAREENLFAYLSDIGARGRGLPQSFLEVLERALGHYGVDSLDRSPELEEALFRLFKAQRLSEEHLAPIASLLTTRVEGLEGLAPDVGSQFKILLSRLIIETQERFPATNAVAREVQYRYYGHPELEASRQKIYERANATLEYLAQNPDAHDRADRIAQLSPCPYSLRRLLSSRFASADSKLAGAILEILVRTYYQDRDLTNVRVEEHDDRLFLLAEYERHGRKIHLIATHEEVNRLASSVRGLFALAERCPAEDDVVLDFYGWRPDLESDVERTAEKIREVLTGAPHTRRVRRLIASISSLASEMGRGDLEHFTFRESDGTFFEDRTFRGLHPMVGKRLNLWRLSEFEIERLPSAEDVHLIRARARKAPKDVRLFALAEVHDLTKVETDEGDVSLPEVERVLMQAFASMRWYLAQQPTKGRGLWHQVELFVHPPVNMHPRDFGALVNKLAPAAEGLGLEKVLINVNLLNPRTGAVRERVLDISNPGSGALSIRLKNRAREPMKPLSEYAQKVARLKERLQYPYELVNMLAPSVDKLEGRLPQGEFIEHDLNEAGDLVPVQRDPGLNEANVVVGLIRNFTRKYPEGMTRVIVLGDPTRGMGALAEPECRRLVAAIDLAEKMQVPVEWFALSAGARISMESGTENLDWVASVLRRIIEFTQTGGTINVVVNGINVGAQPYWNAEATMLMHTRGILIMTPDGSMVLTGKRALDYSGGVSAEDNLGIGGYERIMGPNGEAQYFARDIGEACRILLRYYDHSYVMPGERFPRRAPTTDAADRDVTRFPHGSVDGATFETVGEIFSDATNPARKKPFDIRRVMSAVVDRDQDPLERWADMRDAENAVVWDAHIGGYPICLIGLESRPLPRRGILPADGPEQWSAGTLFPLASKKVARSLSSASGNRPAVFLANLSGFDGSPESLRKLQLEYGAEIGRAVVNFDGPIIFCVISRYHGGAFVVFSNRLNDRMEVSALEGAYASVIGGAPAAAVIFGREVKKRTHDDPRIKELTAEIEAAEGRENLELWTRFNELFQAVHSEKLGEVAEEFDKVHSIERAQRVGSIHHIVAPPGLRPYLVTAIKRGIQRTLKSV